MAGRMQFRKCTPPLLKVSLWLLIGTLAHGQNILVSTSSGNLKGHIANKGSNVTEFLGIPFAEPPVGSLRFSSPQQYQHEGVVHADKYGFSCPAFSAPPPSYPGMTPQGQDIIALFASTLGAKIRESEDCLTLNVWSKTSGQEGVSQKQQPVVVFFYGGRFSLGTSNTPLLNGRHLAECEDVVVVTANYRTNVFGFPGAPSLPQNLGLRDQRMAVEWVRDNIAGFGGDPRRIILVGQSAGASSVDFWTYAYTQDPIVTGIFALSGTALSFPVNTNTFAQGNFEKLVNLVGCNNSTDNLACLRDVEWVKIRDAARNITTGKTNSPLRSSSAFGPTPDNETIFTNYQDRSQEGRFAKLPAVFSNTHNEEGYYQVPAFQRGLEPTLHDINNFLLECFTCPNSFQAQARQAQNVSSWLLRYHGDFDNVRLYRTSGAYHGVDLHGYFGNSEDVTGLVVSKNQAQLTQTMQRALGAFARDPDAGLNMELGWPTYSSASRSLIILGYDNSPDVRFIKPQVYDSFCSNVTMAGLVLAS